MSTRMNERLADLFGRRSIRAYVEGELSDDTVRDLLEAAMAAPSTCAKDPWHFLVIRRKEMLSRIAEGLPNGKMLNDASAGIVVCGDLDAAHDNQLSYLLQDCAAAIENLLLAAHMLGLGACWLGVHPREKRVEHISKLFSLPASVIPVSCIALGNAGERKEARTRYRDDAVHVDRW